MYSIKGSWAGQTFALATTNDSGAKKSRVRRSKEERKTMVESFIKRYQGSNNGNFPSLNLTHKEVGGSFYTVREIVREIIQENRVLGPGEYSYEEEKDNAIGVDYPLGTISSEPQGVLFQRESRLNGFSSQEGKETVVLNFDSNGQFTKHFDLDVVQYSIKQQTDEVRDEHQVDEVEEDAVGLACKSTSHNLEQTSLDASLNDNGQCFDVNEMDSVHFMNYGQTNGTFEESDKLVEGSPECETFEGDGESEQTGAIEGKLSLPTEKMPVETFPLRPGVKETNDVGSASTVSGNLNGDLNVMEAGRIKSSNNTLVFEKDSSSDLVKIKESDSFEVSVSGGSSDMIQHEEINHMAVQHSDVNLKNDSVDIPDSFSVKDDAAIHHGSMNQMSPNGDSTSKTAEQNNLQPKNVSKGTSHLENSNGTSSKNFKEPTVQNRNEKRDGKATVGSSRPLDRIDLESWKASKQETNPLVALFKTFVDAFVRFWSE